MAVITDPDARFTFSDTGDFFRCRMSRSSPTPAQDPLKHSQMDTRVDRFAPLRLKAPPATPRDPMIRVGVIAALPAVIRSLGHDPSQVLQATGFDAALLEDPNNLISFATRSRLIGRCAALTGCPHFGLLLGAQGGLQSLGLVGLLAEYSPDVGSALRNLVRFFHHHLRGASIDVVVDGEIALFDYMIYQPGTEATDQVGAGAMAGAVNIMRALCGAEWNPREVMLAHRRPTDAAPYRRIFRAPIRFDAEQNALVFQAAWLSHPLADREPAILRLLQEKIHALDAQFHEEFPEQVRRVLRIALLTERNQVDDVATLFAMQPRTLNRRLEAFGLSFQALVDEGRFEIARQALLDTDMNVGHVTALLGYAETSSFVRAFQRWSGRTPSEWRAEQRAGASQDNDDAMPAG
jgi:AraC-like DNA-binding protein